MRSRLTFEGAGVVVVSIRPGGHSTTVFSGSTVFFAAAAA